MFKLATIRYIRYQVNYYPVKSGKVVSGTSLPTIQSYKVKNIDDAAMTLAGHSSNDISKTHCGKQE